jgi:hypothetical protein
MSIRTLTAALMRHPQATVYVDQLSAKASPSDLADLYERSMSHGDYESHCMALAIEWHMRNTATYDFGNPEVLEALRRIERLLSSCVGRHRRILRQGLRARLAEEAQA